MIDPKELIQAAEEYDLTAKAHRHYAQTSAYNAWLSERYQRFHSYYAPLNNDQWPDDRARRPGMIHITHNIIQPAVDVESRIESRLPRLTLEPDTDDLVVRERAEKAEKLFKRWLELSGWNIWLNDLAKTKSIYGKGVLKPFWNKRDKRPDVWVIETLQNLRLGWGDSDYSELDWALYEFSLSPYQVQSRWPDVEIKVQGKGKSQRVQVFRHSDHTDPLGQKEPRFRNRIDTQPSDYESLQLRVWDYWCKVKDDDGEEHIVNAFFVEGVLVEQNRHDYLPDIPYIVIEHDHEPGSPEGMGDVEGLIDIQDELNRTLSHWDQLIVDEIDPAYQINADVAPEAPRNGEITAAGDDKEIKAIEKGINIFPVAEFVEQLYRAFHLRSGLSEILFTRTPGAQTAGRALQIQIEATANRIDPRRDRLYHGLQELLIFWAHMAEKINPVIPVGFDEQGQPVSKPVAEIVGGFRRWKFVAPEITPRDNAELITAVINKLNAKLISVESAMDELGVDSPLEMIRRIEQERMNPRLFPADTQQYVAVITLLQQYMANEMLAQQQSAAPGVEQAAGAAQLAQQRAQPQGLQGDNGESVPQPATAEGGAPPGPASPPRLQNQSLIRAGNGEGGQVLQQVRVVTP